MALRSCLLQLQYVRIAFFSDFQRFKKENPKTTEEEEFVENLFNCLCVTCVREENKNYLAKAEGLKLIQIMIKYECLAYED